MGKQLIDLSSRIPKKHKFAPSVSSDSKLFFSFNYSSYREHQISSLTDQDNAVVIVPEHTLTDVNGVKHHQVVCIIKLSIQWGNRVLVRNAPTRACKICKSYGQCHHFYRHTCGFSAAYCVDSVRDCFHKNASIITRSMLLWWIQQWCLWRVTCFLQVTGCFCVH